MTAGLPSGFIKNPSLHAYLFVSPDSEQRRKVSKLMAKSMLCRNLKENAQPCSECDCCIKMEAGTHPDCVVIPSQKKTSVEDIRDIVDEAQLATNEADFKVFILEDADEYNVQSHNALLKVIEEPPSHVRFILTAASSGAILPTVRSRVCSLSGEIVSIEKTIERVKRIKPHLDAEKTRVVSYFVEGYDKADIESLDEERLCEYVNTAHLFLSGKDTSCIAQLPSKREELMLCLQVFMLCIRQLVLAKTVGKAADGIMSNTQFSECNPKVSMKKAHALYDLFEECYLHAEGYANINSVLSRVLSGIKV